ncbi:galactose-1-phosphate uridylyltransferase [Phorcysia thermohydrogeniphila]|uniref:Galactose-1-phosphate uridylyltransferase n=1 Tax=Phorcysia thermohydrogeniphila TaxID=936138 RepID=A0A4R1GP82_9BACT|nr:galactose-1-phosphate uridylyltransferase [Phorcysia thermohydrogeniphila]TCK06262.1 UDPglucose--hexose-1-phosphate uridylyltransferase [Phorcysia thermohydrogeniphila]
MSKGRSEIRYNYLLDTWVIVAPERQNRPHDFSQSSQSENVDPSRCPFEPKALSQEVFALREEGAKPDEWRVKVIPNKYPVLRKETLPLEKGEDFYSAIEGFGVHEVVIDTPDHFKRVSDFSIGELKDLLSVYRERMRELYSDRRVKYVLVFKNYKREAGASIFHPHSQMIALPLVPTAIRKVIEQSRKYYLKVGRCYLCDELSFELKERKRVVYENTSFAVYCPFYSLFPFELRVMPKFHSCDFSKLNDEHLEGLADALLKALKKLYRALDDPPYNLYIHSSPPLFPQSELFFHWYIEIVPRLTVQGGLELGSGFYVNPVPPERAATTLSEVKL